MREAKDLSNNRYVAFLDAKSAIDVVYHDSLMRKLFHIGTEGTVWNLIHSLHISAQTVVKLQGELSEKIEMV